MTLFKLWSVRALLAYILLWGLFLFPYSGLFLMFGMALAGPYLWGLIPHFIILGLVVDILTKKVSQLFWIVPVLLYSGYYVFYSYEEFQIKATELALKNQNPSIIIKYDPEIHSLVSDNSGGIGKYNKIAVVYEENTNFPEGFLSYRVASQNLCREAKALKIENLYTMGVNWYEYKSIHGRNYTFRTNLCQIRSTEVPDQEILKITRTEEDRYSNKHRKKLISETAYTFSLKQQKLGTFTTASVNHLSLLPFIWGGCALNSAAASWDCFFNFYRKRKALDVWPASTNADLYNRDPITAMLQIEKYKEEDLKNFSDYPETRQYISNLSEKKSSEKPTDLNKWGIRKDSLYYPEIGKSGNIDSFRGVVYHGDKGGEFYDFIKEHEGKIVYLNIDAKPNARHSSFSNYGVCKARVNCTNRTDDSYQFFDENGAWHQFPEEGKFKGVFRVGRSENFVHERNQGDNDTITKLIFLRSEP